MKKDMINQYDKNGKPHGLWIWYYCGSGSLSSKGERKNGNGKSIGLWYEKKYY
jgi:hypothetical protein